MPDIAVVGAGLVGLQFCLTCQHHRLPFSIHVFDAKDPKAMFDDKRPLVINGYTQQSLEALGLWPTLAQKAFALCDVHISAQQHPGHVHFAAKTYGKPALGWVIPAGFLYQTLFEALDPKRIVLHTGATLKDIVCSGAQKRLHFIDAQGSDHVVEAQMVIAADGAESKVRTLMHWPVQEDGLFYATVFPNLKVKHHQAPVCAHQRFTPHGSVALLPHNERAATVVWTQRHHDLDPTQLWQHTQATLGPRVGFLDTLMPPVVAYQATMRLPKDFVKDGVYLLGNAAHALPPIAAQGFNLGVRDVNALCHALQGVLKPDDRLASAYQNARVDDVRQTYEACLSIMTVFEPWREPLTPFRTLGFWALASSKILQRLWVGYGSGFFQGVPV